jgi:hypothetical protein
MSWISAEMMRERGPGPYDNYGEMLYAEGLDAAARRQAKVCVCVDKGRLVLGSWGMVKGRL